MNKQNWLHHYSKHIPCYMNQTIKTTKFDTGLEQKYEEIERLPTVISLSTLIMSWTKFINSFRYLFKPLPALSLCQPAHNKPKGQQ